MRVEVDYERLRFAWRPEGVRDWSWLPERFDASAHDLIYIGGGQDRDQVLVAEDMLRTKRDAIAAAVDDGAALLAVCGGYQLLGHRYQLGDESIPGLGIADLVRFLPPVPPAELAEHYRAADVVVVPSHNESFGLVALEA